MMSVIGPTLPTWALQQVGSYLGYTGRDANVVAKAALDPFRRSRLVCGIFSIDTPLALIGGAHFLISLRRNPARYSGVARSGSTRVAPRLSTRWRTAGVA